jgi:hypothetical protein
MSIIFLSNSQSVGRLQVEDPCVLPPSFWVSTRIEGKGKYYNLIENSREHFGTQFVFLDCSGKLLQVRFLFFVIVCGRIWEN